MKKINLKGVSETLNEREMKEVKGGRNKFVETDDVEQGCYLVSCNDGWTYYRAECSPHLDTTCGSAGGTCAPC